MSCKRCPGPIWFTKIVSTRRDFHDRRGACRWRTGSASSFSSHAHDDWPDSRQDEILQRRSCSFGAAWSCGCAGGASRPHLCKPVSDLSRSTHTCREGRRWKNAGVRRGTISPRESGQGHEGWREELALSPPWDEGPVLTIWHFKGQVGGK